MRFDDYDTQIQCEEVYTDPYDDEEDDFLPDEDDDGLHLHVHFDEKDLVKRLGGRWNPDPSGKGGHWWMPKDKLTMDCPIDPDITEEFGVTILQWLNDHKMIAGQYGTLKGSACENWCDRGSEHQMYELLTTNGDIAWMKVYPELDIVEINGPQQPDDQTNWLNMRDARTVWDMLIQGGARKVIRQEETA